MLSPKFDVCKQLASIKKKQRHAEQTLGGNTDPFKLGTGYVGARSGINSSFVLSRKINNRERP
jgi:hypothetical protein